MTAVFVWLGKKPSELMWMLSGCAFKAPEMNNNKMATTTLMLWDVLFVYRPNIRFRQTARVAFKHFCRFFIAFQFPLVPSPGSLGKFATMSLTVSATVAYIHIGYKYRHMRDALNLFHAIVVGDIGFAAQNIEGGGMQFFQIIFNHCRHTGHTATIAYNATVVNYDSCYARVWCHFQGLQTT